jgi:recombinational DNA repair protein (RecF pathway)
VTLVESQPALRHDLSLLRRAAYASALIQQTTESDSPVPEIYDLLVGFVRNLPRHASPLLVLAFEIKLLRVLGLAPDVRASDLSEGSRKSLTYLSDTGWEMLERFKLSEVQFRELRRFLHSFLIFHLGKFPPGRPGALEESSATTSRASKSSAE